MPSLLVALEIRNDASATILCCHLFTTSDVIVLPNSLSSRNLRSSVSSVLGKGLRCLETIQSRFSAGVRAASPSISDHLE